MVLELGLLLFMTTNLALYVYPISSAPADTTIVITVDNFYYRQILIPVAKNTS